MRKIIEQAYFYKNANDLDNALKYASIAAINTYSPTAEVCCLLGELYLMKGNLKWAEIWYKNAIMNTSISIMEEELVQDFYTIIPLLKLGYISDRLGKYEESLEYFNSVLKYDTENEIAKENIEILVNKIA